MVGIIIGINQHLNNNYAVWDEWCKRLSSYFNKSNMRHEILEQITLLLSNPNNVVCLIFEDEMVTKYWFYTHKFIRL